jgi:hypothetical protein
MYPKHYYLLQIVTENKSVGKGQLVLLKGSVVEARVRG